MKISDHAVLSFDCYGTLIDWETGIGTVLRRWADERELPDETEDLLVAFAAHQARLEADQPSTIYPGILEQAMRDLGEQRGVEVSDEDAKTMAESVPHWPAFDDSADALRRLSERFALVILSNVDRESFAASNAKLGVAFDTVLTAQDIGSYKPAQRNFDVLESTVIGMGYQQPQLLHVAQSMFHDHQPAKQRGWLTVWINRRHGNPGWGATPPPEALVDPDWTFASLAEFADAVDSQQ